MKSDAPAEIRREFRPIPSSLPGFVLGEPLTRVARLMHRVALVRSAHHSVNDAHTAAVYTRLSPWRSGVALV